MDPKPTVGLLTQSNAINSFDRSKTAGRRKFRRDHKVFAHEVVPATSLLQIGAWIGKQPGTALEAIAPLY